MTTGDVIGVIGLIILGLTLGAVGWYAWEARKQAEATRQAVEVSRTMTTEIREQRLAQDRPLLVMDLTNSTTGGMRPGRERAVEDCYPDTIAFRVRNVGSGPAIDVDMTVIHPKARYWRAESKGYLLAGESVAYDTMMMSALGSSASVLPRVSVRSASVLIPMRRWDSWLPTATSMSKGGSLGWRLIMTGMWRAMGNRSGS
jgi:hypothetical protein